MFSGKHCASGSRELMFSGTHCPSGSRELMFSGTHCTSGSTELMFSGTHCISGSRELMFSGTHCTSGSRELKTVYPPKFQFYLGNMSLSRGVLTTQQRMSPNNLTSLLELYIYLNPLKHYHYLLN